MIIFLGILLYLVIGILVMTYFFYKNGNLKISVNEDLTFIGIILWPFMFFTLFFIYIFTDIINWLLDKIWKFKERRNK